MPVKKLKPHSKYQRQELRFTTEQMTFILERAYLPGSVAAYFRALMEYDRRHNILPEAVREERELTQAARDSGEAAHV